MSQTSPRCGEYRRARVKVFSASVLSWSPASSQSWLPYVNALSAHRSPRTTARDGACLILSCSANALVAVFPSTGSLMWFSRCSSASKIHAACADRKTPNNASATRSRVLVEVLGFIENPQPRRVVRSVWDAEQLLGQIQIPVAGTFALSEGQPAHDADHQRCGQSQNAVVREQQDKKRDDATRSRARINIVTTAQESSSEKRRRADQDDNNTCPKEWSPHLYCDSRRSSGNFDRIRVFLCGYFCEKSKHCDRCKRGYPRLSEWTRPPSADGQHSDENSGAEQGGKKQNRVRADQDCRQTNEESRHRRRSRDYRHHS